MDQKKILVTQPVLPPLEEFIPLLEDIWESKWITNNGKYHQAFEKALAEYLGVPYISVFSNGTLALITALQCLRITGEVITTPYSFVATTHALNWNGIKPVFCDVEPNFLNICPEKIEAAITSKTSAILPVHVYGHPCQNDKIQEIADNYGLKVINDAAHAFGVQLNGESVLNYGDLSILSFHATKVFNTIEGGAIVSHDIKTKNRIDNLKNFGFVGETKVVAPGINAKMNELQAAYGLLQLKTVDKNISRRAFLSERYKTAFAEIDGINVLGEMEGLRYNHAYFPIFVEAAAYGRTRDELYEYLQSKNIYGRRYFYPLISEFPNYRGLESANKDNLVNANRAADTVICLPMYPELTEEEQDMVIDAIRL